MVPEGAMWTAHILNRTFKGKLIELITMRLPKLLLKRHPGKTVIIDYETPVKHTFVDNEMKQEELTDHKPMGEADVKFIRWANQYNKIMLDSIDGDSIPIALMNHERLLSQEVCPPKVSIYRMKIMTDEDIAEKKKRKLDAMETAGAVEKKTSRQYEYLDIHMLYLGLLQSVRQSIGTLKLLNHNGYEMRMLTALITLTGTDFTRQMPLISGKSMWDMLVHIWMPLTLSYDPLAEQFKLPMTANKLISNLYTLKFANHIAKDSKTLVSVIHDIQHAKKLSDKSKQRFPSEIQITTTIRNCNWVLQYWKCENVPDPISEQFGYAKVGDKTNYMDLV